MRKGAGGESGIVTGAIGTIYLKLFRYTEGVVFMKRQARPIFVVVHNSSLFNAFIHG